MFRTTRWSARMTQRRAPEARGRALRAPRLRVGYGVMFTRVAEGRQLFASTLSITTARSSAQARRKYRPSGVADGIVTVIGAPGDETPAPRLATERTPTRSVSPAPFSPSVER